MLNRDKSVQGAAQPEAGETQNSQEEVGKQNLIPACSRALAAFSLDQKNKMNLDMDQRLSIKSGYRETKHRGPHRVRKGGCFEASG